MASRGWAADNEIWADIQYGPDRRVGDAVAWITDAGMPAEWRASRGEAPPKGQNDGRTEGGFVLRGGGHLMGLGQMLWS